jgi:hypothetical protein
MGESYWANTCPYCRALQGDFYLFGHEGPFAGVEEVVPAEQLLQNTNPGWSEWELEYFFEADKQ